MTASTDAVRTGGSGRRKPRRPLPPLLTATVIVLIYQQLPPPLGLTVLQDVLRWALPVLAAGLLAQFARQIATHVKQAFQTVREIFTLGIAAWREQRRNDDSDDPPSS